MNAQSSNSETSSKLFRECNLCHLQIEVSRSPVTGKIIMSNFGHHVKRCKKRKSHENSIVNGEMLYEQTQKRYLISSQDDHDTSVSGVNKKVKFVEAAEKVENIEQMNDMLVSSDTDDGNNSNSYYAMNEGDNYSIDDNRDNYSNVSNNHGDYNSVYDEDNYSIDDPGDKYFDDDGGNFFIDNVQVREHKPGIHQMFHSIRSATNILESSGASEKAFIHQLKLFDYYSNIDTMKIKRAKHQIDKPNWQSLVKLYGTMLDSESNVENADKWLKTISDLQRQSDPQSKLILPSSFRTIHAKFSNEVIKHEANTLFDLRKFEWKMSNFCKQSFPDNIYPNATSCYCYDIIQLLSEQLLNVAEPKHFIRDPDIRYETGKEGIKESRIYIDYTTGQHYEKAVKTLRQQKNDIKAVFLALGATLDETTSRSSKRSETPLAAYILNLINDDFMLILLSYVPKHLPYSDAELMKKMAVTNDRIGIRKTIIKMAKRQMMYDFVYFAIQPILEYQEKGLKLRVGRFDNTEGFDIVAYPHLVNLSGDNMQLDDTAGTSIKSKTKKCRICVEENCTRNIEDIAQFRDESLTEQIGSTAQIFILKKFNHNHDNEGYNKAIELCKKHNIKAGVQPLIYIQNWQKKNGINSFHQSLPPDILHTVEEGVGKHLVVLTADIIQLIGKIDPNYSNAMSTLDERIKIFPLKQTLPLSKQKTRFSSGVSPIFKSLESLAKAANRGSGGFVGGGMEAWKIIELCFQMLFCLNNDIIPMKHNDYKGTKKSDIKWNPGLIVINALSAYMCFYFSIKARVATEKQINGLQKIVTNLRAHLCLMWLMRKDLILVVVKQNSTKSKSTSSEFESLKDTKLFEGIKQHLLVHFKDMKLIFGADNRTNDTQKSERYHIECYKLIVELSSKRYDNSFFELLCNYRRRVHCKYLITFIEKTLQLSNSTPPSPPVSFESTPTIPDFFEHTTHYGYDDLSIVNEQLLFRSHNKTTLSQDTEAVNKNVICVEDLNTILSNVNRYMDAPTTTVFKTRQRNPYTLNDSMFFLNEGERENVWKLFKENKCNVKLLKSITCHSGERKYNIMCHNHYPLNKHSSRHISTKKFISVCNFVIVEINGIACPVEVCAIFSSCKPDNTEKVSLHLMVAELKLQHGKASVLNFPIYKYDYKSLTGLQFHIVPTRNILEPVCMIPHSLTLNCWDQLEANTAEQIKSFQTKLFACVQLDYLERDYNLEYVAYDKHLILGSHTDHVFSSSDLTCVSDNTATNNATAELNRKVMSNLKILFDNNQVSIIDKYVDDLQNIDEDVDSDRNSDSDGDI